MILSPSLFFLLLFLGLNQTARSTSKHAIGGRGWLRLLGHWLLFDGGHDSYLVLGSLVGGFGFGFGFGLDIGGFVFGSGLTGFGCGLLGFAPAKLGPEEEPGLGVSFDAELASDFKYAIKADCCALDSATPGAIMAFNAPLTPLDPPVLEPIKVGGCGFLPPPLPSTPALCCAITSSSFF